MSSDNKSEMTNILLESGTNELEVVEFTVGDLYYGINVTKVREIIRYPESVVPIPNAKPSVEGIVNVRGTIIPVVNLAKHLGKDEIQDVSKSRIIISEFNNMTVGFWVSAVARIHRLSWKQVEASENMVSSADTYVVAVVKMDDRLVLLLDFEKIAADINPESSMRGTEETKFTATQVSFNRADKTIVIAEDSSFIRDLLLEYLHEAGYATIDFSDGEKAWGYLEKTKSGADFKSIDQHVHLIISDIEMPCMDGLTLIKSIKEDKALGVLPCVVFSSMITEELRLKCKAVGSDAEVTKPEVEGLIGLVDDLVLK